MKNIVCLISGRGSNMEALLRAQAREQWERRLGARVRAVVSNRPDAAGLALARSHGVDTHVVDHRAHGNRAAFEAALRAAIEPCAPVLVVLAGFLRVLGDEFTTAFAGRLVNIHPSLLPAFPGLDTHARALQAGVRVHGATVHYVSGVLDGGPIIAQAALAVDAQEDAAALGARVLALEHVLLPRCVGWILEGRVRLEGDRVATGGLGPHELLMGPE